MPTKERLADRNVTTTELALILGITGRRVQQLTQDYLAAVRKALGK